MSLSAEIVQLDANQLDNFFDGTPTADNIPGATEASTTQVSSNGTLENLQEIEAREKAEKEAEEAELLGKTAGKTPEQIAEEKVKAEAEAKAKAEKEAEDKDKVPAEQINAVLKNTVDYLVKTGQWVDFDGRENLEMTEEVYADLVSQQDEYRVTDMFDKLVDSTGAYGKAIINHIKNNGNPDEIIDIFKEQNKVNQIDTSTEAGKQSLIEKYYTEVLGWKPDKVQKTIKRLITDDEIGTEFTDTKDLYEKHYAKQLAEVNKAANDQKEAEKVRTKQFTDSIKAAIDEDTTITPQQKAILASNVLDFKHKLADGRKVNDFYVKFAEMQANPKEYVRLVQFVMNREAYEKQRDLEKTTKIAKDTFNFVKGNAALGKTKATQVDIDENGGKSGGYKGTDFSLALKRS